MDCATALFQELFNVYYNQNSENITKIENAKNKNDEIKRKIAEVATHKIQLTAIEKIIKTLWNSKSTGISEIPNEAIK